MSFLDEISYIMQNPEKVLGGMVQPKDVFVYSHDTSMINLKTKALSQYFDQLAMNIDLHKLTINPDGDSIIFPVKSQIDGAPGFSNRLWNRLKDEFDKYPQIDSVDYNSQNGLLKIDFTKRINEFID